jgi:4-amino-4-deoxy-L-arabinose transferase-like glycosyltransferase
MRNRDPFLFSPHLTQRVALAWPIGVILAVALLARLWGIDFGLPYAHHIDEPRYISAAVGIIQTGNFNPGWFQQPTFYTYFITIILSFYFLFGRMIGYFDDQLDLFQPPYHFDGFIPLPGEFLIARVFTALAGVLTVFLVYQISYRWHGREAAIVSASFLALSIFHVTSSHFIATDIPVTLLILVALYLYTRLATTGATRYYIWAGIFTGLAIGTKYSAYVLIFPAFLSHLIAWHNGRSHLFWRPIYLSLSTAIAFLATTPYALLDYSAFTRDVQYEWLHHKTQGHIGSEGNSGYWFIIQLLTRSDRWMTLAAIGGYLVAAKKRQWEILIVVCYTLAYFLSMAGNVVHFERFLVPLTPALALGAGNLAAYTRQRLKAHSYSFLVPLVIASLLIEPAFEVIRFNYYLGQPDVGNIARGWIRENLPTGSSIARERYAPNLDQEPFTVHDFAWLNSHPVEWYREQGFDYLIFASARYGVLYRNPERYATLIDQYETMFQQLELVAHFHGPYVGRADHEIQIYRLTQ